MKISGIYKIWNKGLTKKTDERVLRSIENSGKARKGQPSWNKGKTHTSEHKQNQLESLLLGMYIKELKKQGKNE